MVHSMKTEIANFIISAMGSVFKYYKTKLLYNIGMWPENLLLLLWNIPLSLSLSLSLSHTHTHTYRVSLSLSHTHTPMWSNMEVIYDAFEIPVPISPPGPIKVCPTPPALKVPSPRKLLILQIPPAQKLVRRESIREKKKVKQLCLDPKKRRYWAKFSWEN